MRTNPNIEMLEIVAHGLGDFCNEIVFVGGAVTALYLHDPAATDIRPTNDVDCVIEMASIKNYYQVEEKLRTLGFQNHIGSLICRWIYCGIFVDIMTTDKAITGFTNQWYASGIQARIKTTLPSGKEIHIFSLPYFIATKFEAFSSRGQNDYRTSHDIEDIITVLDGHGNENILSGAPSELNQYLKNEFSKFEKRPDFEECLYSHISRTGDTEGRARRLQRIIQKCSEK